MRIVFKIDTEFSEEKKIICDIVKTQNESTHITYVTSYNLLSHDDMFPVYFSNP